MITYQGPGIRNLWLNDIKGAITNLSQSLEPKVDQSNFIFNSTETLESNQKPSSKQGSLSRQRSKGRLSFNRKSIIKYNNTDSSNRKDSEEFINLESSKEPIEEEEEEVKK